MYPDPYRHRRWVFEKLLLRIVVRLVFASSARQFIFNLFLVPFLTSRMCIFKTQITIAMHLKYLQQSRIECMMKKRRPIQF